MTFNILSPFEVVPELPSFENVLRVFPYYAEREPNVDGANGSLTVTAQTEATAEVPATVSVAYSIPDGPVTEATFDLPEGYSVLSSTGTVYGESLDRFILSARLVGETDSGAPTATLSTVTVGLSATGELSLLGAEPFPGSREHEVSNLVESGGFYPLGDGRLGYSSSGSRDDWGESVGIAEQDGDGVSGTRLGVDTFLDGLVIALDDGGFLYMERDTSSDVTLQQFDSDGVLINEQTLTDETLTTPTGPPSATETRFIQLDENGDLEIFVEDEGVAYRMVLDLGPEADEPEIETPLPPVELDGSTDGDDILTLTDADDVFDALGGDDKVIGGEGDDVINGGSGADLLRGSAGNDSLFGDNGADTLFGGASNDVLYGGQGFDLLVGGQDDDSLYGGRGKDVLHGGDGNDYMDGGSSDDNIRGGDGDDEIFGGDGRDNLNGGDGADMVSGGAGNDNIHGLDGDDQLFGGDGDDRLHGDRGDDEIEGGSGNDLLIGAAGEDEIFGGNGDDTLRGGAGRDDLNGGNGNDDMRGGSDRDEIYGGDGADVLQGDAGNDVVFGGEANDAVYGGDGVDWVAGGAGNDTVYGGSGDDSRVDGNEGDDTLFGGDGGDRMSGGDGNDLLYGDAGNDVMSGRDGDDVLYGGDGVDQMWGGNGDDALYGGGGAYDRLYGQEGDDTLIGGLGNDIFLGGSGNDTLYGGGGDDQLGGGTGADVFSFDLIVDQGEDIDAIETNDTGIDTISDFAIGEDKIVLDGSYLVQGEGDTDPQRVAGELTFDDIFLSQEESAAVIQAGETLIRLENVDANDLSEDDFSFL